MANPLEVGESVIAAQGSEIVEFVFDGFILDDRWSCWLVTAMGERVLAPLLAVGRPGDRAAMLEELAR